VTRISNSSGVWRDKIVVDLIFGALCVFALVKAIQTTGDLRWPYDLDQFREIGIAQSILDHRYWTDHLYRGETIWYNPLTSVVVATLTRLSSTPVYLVVTRAGPYLNLLGPIAFYILVAYLFERWTALAAAAAFLFAPIGEAPGWAAATYSPWLFSPNFTQAFFYFGLASYAKALRSTRLRDATARQASWRWEVVTGLLLGLTFLGHTAPAVIFGAIIVAITLTSLIASGENRAMRLRGPLIIFATAFIVSLPFTFSILFHYHLRVVNPVPGNWLYPSVDLKNLTDLLRTFLSLFTLVALIGLVATLKGVTYHHRKALLVIWLIIVMAALSLNELQQFISPDLHLMPVPAHHFLFYLHALEDIFFGVGLMWICRFCAQRLPASAWTERAITGLAIICFLVAALPSYWKRFDFTKAREHAIGFQERADYFDAYRWILENTKPENVFLSLSGDLDLSVVGPADRKTVVTCQPEFSNPYVSWKDRVETATQIVDKLAAGAPDVRAMLSAAHVDYIITAPINQFDQAAFSFLSKEFGEGNVAIYKVRTD
jgi:hypothetical protein